jgi:flagellar biogenesis protein FliO
MSWKARDAPHSSNHQDPGFHAWFFSNTPLTDLESALTAVLMLAWILERVRKQRKSQVMGWERKTRDASDGQ